jgi:hypothetical protein
MTYSRGRLLPQDYQFQMRDIVWLGEGIGACQVYRADNSFLGGSGSNGKRKFGATHLISGERHDNWTHDGDTFEAVPDTQSAAKYSSSTPMSLSSIAKQVINPQYRTLVKAGFLDSELRLTNDGRAQLEALFLTTNIVALVAAAEEVLAERKEEKGC